MDKLLDKFKDLERRFNDLEREMSNPEAINDNKKFSELNKVRLELQEPVEAYLEYKKVLFALEETRDLIENSNDKELAEMAEEEFKTLKEKEDDLKKHLYILLIPKDPNDDHNAYIEIRGGTGGEEAAIFARDMCEMYVKYSQNQNWNYEIVDSNESDAGGFAKVIIFIQGTDVYGKLKYESGIHRVQRVPVTEASGRLHTSAATVAVLPEIADLELNVDLKDIKVDTYRASGAGGQHINKTDSAVRLTHLPTGIVVACQDERSQHKNKDKAMSLLKSKIWEAMEEERFKKEKDTRKMMVGTGDRSEKIRTYNYPQNRVTDHRINFSLHKLESIMQGDLAELIQALKAADNLEKLKKL